MPDTEVVQQFIHNMYVYNLDSKVGKRKKEISPKKTHKWQVNPGKDAQHH